VVTAKEPKAQNRKKNMMTRNNAVVVGHNSHAEAAVKGLLKGRIHPHGSVDRGIFVLSAAAAFFIAAGPAADGQNQAPAPVAPNTRSVVPNSGAIAPGTGSVAPNGGAVAPNTGTVIPNSGAVVPNTGSMAPNGGAVAPNTGTVIPNSGAIVPNTRTVMPNSGVVAPINRAPVQFRGTVSGGAAPTPGGAPNNGLQVLQRNPYTLSTNNFGQPQTNGFSAPSTNGFGSLNGNFATPMTNGFGRMTN
jgi:hypothetical protein